MIRCISHALLATLLLQVASLVQAAPGPQCPGHAATPYPDFSQPGMPPAVKSWPELSSLPVDCHIQLQTRAPLTVALAGQFKHKGTINDIASRFGSISGTQNLPYWSVTDNAWRKLISRAVALKSSDKKTSRPDFTAQEILADKTKYFAQNDTRSWGLNVYRFQTISASSDNLVLLSDNVSPVKLGPITLFEPHDAQTVLFINKAGESIWTYYSLAVVKKSAIAAREKSLINRQAAFYRYLIGTAPDKNPPLAP